jgi:hypothetical protein
MISEYRVSCPKCLGPTAIIRRESNSLATYIDCFKCGFKREGVLPRADEKLAKNLLNLAICRLAARERFSSLLRLLLPVAFIAMLGIYFHDVKLAVVLVGVLVIVQLWTVDTQKQLTHILNCVEPRTLISGDLEAIRSGDITATDLVHDYAIAAGAFNEDEVAKLDNRYNAFVQWLGAALRSLGCSESTVSKETSKYYDELQNTIERFK